MLNTITADHFDTLVGRSCKVEPEGRAALELTVTSVRRHSGAQLPDDPPEMREPFSVILTGSSEASLVDASCAVDLSGPYKLEKVQVTRIAPLSRDPAKAYFQIIFN